MTIEDERSIGFRDQVSQLRRLTTFVRPYRTRLVIGTSAVVVAAGLGLVFPAIIGTLVDTALGDAGDPDRVNVYAVALLGVFAFQAGFNYIRSYNLAIVGEGVVADLRRETFDRLVRLPVPFFDERHTGDLTSRLTADVVTVQGIVADALGRMLSQGITLVGGVILAVSISPQLSLSILTFLPIIIIASYIFGRRLRRISTEFHDQLASANSVAEEAIASIRVVKWFGAEDRLAEGYDAEVRASYEAARRRARMRSIFVPLVTFVAFSTLALVLWLGGRLVASGSLSAGDLVAFLLYTLTIAGAIGSFTSLYSEVQETAGASKRIFELLGEVPEDDRTDDGCLPEPIGSVSLRGVEFAYAGRDAAVLRGIDLDVRSGEMVALVGPSGAGKSTISQLIPRFYDVDAGSVEVDGRDVRDYPVTHLRERMAAVPQEVQMFSGTIAENLRIADPSASDEDVIVAAKAANAHRFIDEFPDGYDSVVGERGVKLSGGQRQRVAIARAVLADPRILILDEATSSLDAESESLVQEALERLMVGRTTIVIAHRLSTVIRADRLVVIDRGRIVEEGSHQHLIAADGLYAQLYATQLS